MRAGKRTRSIAVVAGIAALLAACGGSRGGTDGASDGGPTVVVRTLPGPGTGGVGTPGAREAAGWPKRFAGPVLSIATNPDGRVFVLFRRGTPGPLVLGAYDATGALLWEQAGMGAHARHASTRGVAAAPDGGAYLSYGASYRGGDGAVVRVSRDGAILWSITVAASGVGPALSAAADGRVVVHHAGSFQTVLDASGEPALAEAERSELAGSGYTSLAFDAGGALLGVRAGPLGGDRHLVKIERVGLAWEERTEMTSSYSWFNAFEGGALAISPDGRSAAVLGEPNGAATLHLHDAGDGKLLSTLSQLPVCCSLSLDASGAVVLAGTSSAGIAVAKLSPSGALVAERALAPPGGDGLRLNALAVARDGGVFVGGENGGAEVSLGAVAIAPGGGFVAALGAALEAGFGAAGPARAPEAAARWVSATVGELTTVAPDAAGGAFVTRSEESSLEDDALELRSVGADGSLRWAKRFGGFWERSALGLAATPDGGVLVPIRLVCAIQRSACTRFAPDLGGGAIPGSALVKFGADGALEWQLALSSVWDTSVAVGPAGEIALVEYYALTLRGPDGALRWETGAGWHEDGSVIGASAFDRDGNVYAARFERRGFGGAYRLASWSLAGSLRWIGPSIEGYDPWLAQPGSLRVSVAADGSVAVSWLRATESGEVLTAVGVDAATGAERWRATAGDWPVTAGTVLAAPGGGALVAGELRRDGCGALAIVQLDGTGRIASTRTLAAQAGCVGAPRLVAAALAPDGAVLVGGVTSVAADVGGTAVPARTWFLASMPPP